MHQIISTNQAPSAIGTYNQAVKAGNTVYFSGNIGLQADTMELISHDFKEQVEQMFRNFKAIMDEAGVEFKQVVKLTVFLTDMNNFPILNEVMRDFWPEPYPARAAVEVSGLPKGALVELEGIAVV